MSTQQRGTNAPENGHQVSPQRNSAPVLDVVDRQILAELRADARITNRALAHHVGLSAPACLRRVRRLHENGVIRRYTIDVGPGAHSLVAYVGVRLAKHAQTTLTRFERLLAGIPGVVQASQVTGQFDYLLRVEVDDLPAYRRFHTHELAALPGIAQVTTFVVVEDIDMSRT